MFTTCSNLGQGTALRMLLWYFVKTWRWRNFNKQSVFCDEDTSHLSRYANRQNVRMLGGNNPPELAEGKKDTPKVQFLLCCFQTEIIWALHFSKKHCDCYSVPR